MIFFVVVVIFYFDFFSFTFFLTLSLFIYMNFFSLAKMIRFFAVVVAVALF